MSDLNKKKEEKKDVVSVMDKICVVIDLEGFQVKSRGGFQVRELGYCDWRRVHAGSYRYQLTGYVKDLPKEEQATVSFVTKHVHGLPYRAFYKGKCLTR